MNKLLQLLMLLLWAWPAAADSPLTSTDFWRAYRDVPEVVMAHDLERLNTQLGYYLLSQAPIDRKAAVINALSWNFHGKQNAVLFREILEQKYSGPNYESRLNGDELFCLGYLTALDDYFHAENALPWLGKARKAHPKSFTVALVGALVEAQTRFQHFEELWPITERVLNDRNLKRDLRTSGVKIVTDYMKLYQKYVKRG